MREFREKSLFLVEGLKFGEMVRYKLLSMILITFPVSG